MIEVCIVDDQRLMRDGLRTLINLEQDLNVAVMAANGEDALTVFATHPCDVVLMDIRMPKQDGITTTRLLKERWPDVKILMLTTYDEREDVVGALSAGAVGYLLKDMPAEEIAAAIRTAYAGGAVLPPGIANTFLTAVQKTVASGSGPNVAPQLGTDFGSKSDLVDSLTERESDVLNCLAEGLSNREIAERLFVTEGTVKNHVSSLIAKLALRDRTQVALYAVRHGFGAYGE